MRIFRNFSSTSVAAVLFVLVILMAGTVGYCVEGHIIGIAAGNGNTVVLYSNGTMKACGNGYWGCNGNGSWSDKYTLYPVMYGDYKKVALNHNTVMAIKASGELDAWGSNEYHCLGNSSSFTSYACNTPTKVGYERNWKDVSAGYGRNFALNAEGELYAAGLNSYNQLGLNNYTGLYVTDFTFLNSSSIGNNDWTYVDTNGARYTAIKSDGTLWVWGYNGTYTDYLGLGDLAVDYVTTPTQVFLNTTSAEDDDWVKVSNGTLFTLGLKSDGTLWAWGYNTYGQLGQGDQQVRSTPVQVPGTGWIDIATGRYFSLAIKADGTLWAWGDNCAGQLGLGDYDDRHTPTQVAVGRAFVKDWIMITAGYQHTVGVRADGGLWTWGSDSYGQLGRDETYYDYNEPGQVM